MVGHGLGVGRTHANVNQRNTGIVFPQQMIRRHLRHARRVHATGLLPLPCQRYDIARLHQRRVVALFTGQHTLGPLAELIDIELVVGKQHITLKILGPRRRVVLQTMQGIVDAWGGKRGKGFRFALLATPGTVHDRVVSDGQIGHIEVVA